LRRAPHHAALLGRCGVGAAKEETKAGNSAG